MDTDKNARLTPKGREAMVRAVVENELSHAVAARHSTPRRRLSPNGLNASASRFGWFAGSVVAAPFIARPNPAGHMRFRRGFAPAALDWQADRRRSRDIAGNREPFLRRLGPQQVCALEPAEPIRRYERESPAS